MVGNDRLSEGLIQHITTNAGTSETNAAASATTAAGHVTTASGHVSTASGHASTASTQATNAANSASAASTSASNADTSKTNAASSATAAASSATASATSASTATTQASTATTQATNAATSATNAAASAASAANTFDSFDDRYLGVKSSNPSTDNDGNALAAGALYFNSSTSAMMVYDGSSWIQASSATSALITTFKYVATSNQTTFSGNDVNSASLSYTANNILVRLNGIVLDATDYTASNGNSVVLGTGAATGDELVVTAFSSFTAGDAVSATTGGIFGGNIQVNGGIIGSGAGSYIQLPTMTTTQRNAISANNGMLVYNTTDNKFQGYENGAWANLI